MSNLYSHITATGSTVVCPKSAILDKITINSAVTGGTVTAYNFATTTGATGSAATITTTDSPKTLEYGIDMKNGIVINNATGSHDITVSYKVA